MEGSISAKLLSISALGLAAAGIIFLVLTIMGNRESWMIGAALGCVVLSNLFWVIRNQIREK